MKKPHAFLREKSVSRAAGPAAGAAAGPAGGAAAEQLPSRIRLVGRCGMVLAALGECEGGERAKVLL